MIPKTLYEILPYLYLSLAIVLLLLTDSWFKYPPVVVLTILATVILYWRRSYRLKMRSLRARR